MYLRLTFIAYVVTPRSFHFALDSFQRHQRPPPRLGAWGGGWRETRELHVLGMCLIKKIVSFPLLASLFTLHSSLFAFGKGQGPTCDWPGGLAGRCPPTASISAKSRQLSPSRHTLQTSLFTLHSSLFAFGKGQGPTCDWPGGLAGRAPPTASISDNFRHSHVISLHRFSAAASLAGLMPARLPLSAWGGTQSEGRC